MKRGLIETPVYYPARFVIGGLMAFILSNIGAVRSDFAIEFVVVGRAIFLIWAYWTHLAIFAVFRRAHGVSQIATACIWTGASLGFGTALAGFVFLPFSDAAAHAVGLVGVLPVFLTIGAASAAVSRAVRDSYPARTVDTIGPIVAQVWFFPIGLFFLHRRAVQLGLLR